MRTITTDSMVTVVFTGDSQTTGRNLAIDYPQLLSRLLPVRVINTSVGGSSSDALVKPMTGGTARIAKGEHILYGVDVRWGMGPFPGMTVSVAGEPYTIDSVAEHPPTRDAELHLVEPARAGYAGEDVVIEPGWHVRVAQHRPAVVCLMFINDGAMPVGRLENWREMLRRSRAMGAVPVLMSPFPVDEYARGGNHPGFNDKVLQNAAAVRALAEEEKAWFVDVAHLALALDPPLRCQVRDGIHPDTDGQTVAINGLLWVFEQMGLTLARPSIRGWVLTGPPAPLDDLLAGGARPFCTSQPDHPDPDHQSEKGFTLNAIRRQDEYGLIARTDGYGLAVASGILLRLCLEADSRPRRVLLRVAGSGITAVSSWHPSEAAWYSLACTVDAAAVRAELPAEGWEAGSLHVLVRGADGAVLDGAAFEVEDSGKPGPWQPAPRQPSAYVLESDHVNAANRVHNPDFAAGAGSLADGWVLRGDAQANRPHAVTVARVSFATGDALREVVLHPVPGARPYDLLVVAGSAAGNDGPYRVLADLGEGRLRLRRPAKAPEVGLSGQVLHDDGCGLVPGGCCVELGSEGQAETVAMLPPGATDLVLSLFTRVYAPTKLGTRDVPGRQRQVTVQFRGDHGQPLGRPWALESGMDSYQWQKVSRGLRAPAGAAEAVVTLGAAGPDRMQYTGVFLGPAAAVRQAH